ncbi:hypothetical protein SY94_0966 [Agrobacterium tumefaciens]|nr:hypothetical protein SY94_0966 [Agrobacterium tumefaciens]
MQETKTAPAKGAARLLIFRQDFSVFRKIPNIR